MIFTVARAFTSSNRPGRQAEPEVLKALKDDLGDAHGFVKPGEEQELSGYQRVVYMPSAGQEPLEVLSHGLKLIQKAQQADPGPEVWFALRGTQATRPERLKDEAVPLHAGLWGLARCLRLEMPGAVCGCVDLGSKATDVLKRQGWT